MILPAVDLSVLNDDQLSELCTRSAATGALKVAPFEALTRDWLAVRRPSDDAPIQLANGDRKQPPSTQADALKRFAQHAHSHGHERAHPDAPRL